MSKSVRQKIIACLLSLLFTVIFSGAALAKDEVRFLKYNVHTQSKNGKTFTASYANYTNPGGGHLIIPSGTEILITKKSRKSFTFKCDNGTKVVIYEFHKKRMGMSLDEYLDKITSTEQISHADLSKQDQKGLADGKAYQGMTKQGVMAALGYPAAHRTPSLEANSWTYWTNRFGTIIVEFDAQGLVSGVRD